jgi:hypothetical protein
LTSVQKYFKPLIFESKFLFNIKKSLCCSLLGFRPIFVSPSLPPKPARSARPLGPVHQLPPQASIGTAAPPAVPLCRAPPTAALLRKQRANHCAVMPPSLPPLNQCCPVSSSPLTPLKPMRSKTPPPPAASPPPHRLPGPIKCTPPPPLCTTLIAPLLRSSLCPQ